MTLHSQSKRKPRIYKSGRFWAVRYGNVGGVFPSFAAACDAARYYARWPYRHLASEREVS